MSLRATEILGEEHRWIGVLLECLAKLLEDAAARGSVDPRAPEVLELCELFADGSHQHKEEALLFPCLMRRSTEEELGLLRGLGDEHREDRYRMRSMQTNLLGALYGEPLCLRELVAQGKEYVRLHGNHMQRENRGLFPLAERVLTARDDRELVEGFETLEEGGAAGRERLRRRIEELGAHFGVAGSTSTQEGA